MNQKSNKAFTLIELLVVISIIAILSTIGLVYYGNFIKSSRDAKRQSDLKFIQSALEDYKADQQSYPASLSVLTTGTRVYMSQIPSDPKPPPDYAYIQSGTSYCLYAQMEGTLPSSDQGCTSPPTGFTASKTYGVTRP